MSQEEYRQLVAATANRLLELYEAAGVKPSSEVVMASALVYVTGAKHAGITKEACIEAIGDAYDNADFYMQGEEAPGVNRRFSYLLLKRTTDLQGRRNADENSGLGWTYVQTFLSVEAAEDAKRAAIHASNQQLSESDFTIKEVPIG